MPTWVRPGDVPALRGPSGDGDLRAPAARRPPEAALRPSVARLDRLLVDHEHGGRAVPVEPLADLIEHSEPRPAWGLPHHDEVPAAAACLLEEGRARRS